MAKTVSTALGEVIVVEMELTEEDSGYCWNLKWIPAELRFLEQQTVDASDDAEKQRFFFHTTAEPVGAMAKLFFVLQSDESLDDVKATEEVTVIWNTELKFVSYNPNNDLPFKHKNDLPFKHKAELPFRFNGNLAGDDGRPMVAYGYSCADPSSIPLVAYGYPCVAQTTIPYGVFGSNADMIYSYPNDAGMKYGYACTAQTSVPYGYCAPMDAGMKYGYACTAQTSVPYGYCAPMDAGMKYGYACNAQASMPYGYGLPNYDGK